MRVVRPFEITNAKLLSSSVAEPSAGEVVFDIATLFLKGQKSIIGSPTSAVTITMASPGVVGWTAHGLKDSTPVVFTTTTDLPLPLLPGVRYYVINSATNTFQVTDEVGGLPIVTTTAGVGTHTATAEVHRTFESQRGTTAPILSITQATPGVVSVNDHGMAANTPVLFATTATLPAPLVAGTVYYISPTGLAPSSFSVAATVGGTPIATTTAGSGSHTAVFNPNIGHPPLRDDGSYWLDKGPTNAWAMFDTLRSTRTYGTSPMVFSIKPGERFDSYALINVIADQIDVLIQVPGYPDINETIVMNTREGIINWYLYYYTQFQILTSLVRLNGVPALGGVTITFTLTRGSGQVGVGGVVLGRQVDLGTTQPEAEVDKLNFSKITRDEQGSSILVRRRTVPKTSQTIRFQKANTKAISNVLDDLAAVPALWVGIDDDSDGYFDAVMILGIYKRASMNLDLPDWGVLSLDLEEV